MVASYVYAGKNWPILFNRRTGDKVNPVTDADHEGVLAIDAEVGEMLRKKSRIDDFSKSEGVDSALRQYAT
ncbi:hypothetical protein [Amycolatopsis decaplanina]|uniref:Uncharacterized protein n=1 Tax=Amycolatopsis decaplanina DSM 44594 TaxID=1284240 RepID=M2ZKN6_9PSEU|nr:hypothetical protein [Amycolatopsis decaplanina]EME60934.1 hypothetical protein H074_12422 [Amycolatopsis decaplanina DSM 44594]